MEMLMISICWAMYVNVVFSVVLVYFTCAFCHSVKVLWTSNIFSLFFCRKVYHGPHEFHMHSIAVSPKCNRFAMKQSSLKNNGTINIYN